MAYQVGDKIRVTQLQKKDFEWFDNDFEEMSAKVNEKEGVITSHMEATPEFSERETYMVTVAGESLELEEDEMERVSEKEK